jgi:1-acyl-sn-glycerol-3-phosphate acyltransferase
MSSEDPDKPTGDSDHIGRHRDRHMDAAVDELGFPMWESETDVLSIEHLRHLWEKFTESPTVGEGYQFLAGAGGTLIRRMVTSLLSATEERETDEYGYDPAYLEKVFPLAKWFHDSYFRVEASGVEHIPAEGRVLLVANHSGTLPYDGAMIVTTVRIRHPQQRLIRSLVENVVYHFPYLGMVLSRIGAVRACQENATRLLEQDEPVLVFPEGIKGIGKLFSRRYRLQRFGRGGAIKLAMRTGAPIIPVSIVGAEESMPLLTKVTWLARPLGLPYIPITPTLPFLGPLGLIPYPTKWYIDFGEPMDMARYGKDGVQDRVLVNRLNEEVRGRIQGMIDKRLTHRDSVFGG